MLELRTRTEDIWIIDSKSGEASKFTFDPHNDIWPVWSPDGSRVAFSSDRQAGDSDLYTKPSDGGAGEQLLLKSGAETLAAPLSWSPDNKFLVFRNFAPFSNMAVLPLEGDPRPRMFERVSFTQAQGQVSPSGKWLAYHSTESGPNEVYVQSFPTAGAKWQSLERRRLLSEMEPGRQGALLLCLRWTAYGRARHGRCRARNRRVDSSFKAQLLNGPTVGIGLRAQYQTWRVTGASC